MSGVEGTVLAALITGAILFFNGWFQKFREKCRWEKTPLTVSS
ncbi:MAG: hypothetical protein V1792_03435 [Pseudomonadota bacterium]